MISTVVSVIIRVNYFQVRRTRISERMRKLQELVPNMDKVGLSSKYLGIFVYFFLWRVNILLFFPWQQTNTADMLDLAVDYIKDLQEQFKV